MPKFKRGAAFKNPKYWINAAKNPKYWIRGSPRKTRCGCPIKTHLPAIENLLLPCSAESSLDSRVCQD